MPSHWAATALSLALCLGHGAALRLVDVPASPAEDAAQRPSISSFVSHDGLLCVQGEPRNIEGLLALRKAGPHGALYSETYATNETCESLGYLVDDVEDRCFPSTWRFVREEPDKNNVTIAEAAALYEFAGRYDLSEDQAVLMAACACHPLSKNNLLLHVTGDRCKSVRHVPAAWMHRDPANGRKLMCNEGPFTDAVYALATMKSTGQLPMHQHDQIAVASCEKLGFPVMYPPDDHCFPSMKIWTKTPLDIDEGVNESKRIEAELFSGGFLRWAQERKLNTWQLWSFPGCHCELGSSVRSMLGPLCSKPEAHSPITDILDVLLADGHM